MMRNWIENHPWLYAAGSIVVIFGLFETLRIFTGPDLINLSLRESIFALLTLAAVWMAAKKGSLALSTKGMGFVLKKSWDPLLIAFVFGLISVIGMVSWFSAGSLVMSFTVGLIYCLAIGIFEEGLFRGLLLNAFLKTFGKTANGLILSAVVSSLIFGVLHIAFEEYTDWISLLSGAFKILQTGILGFLLAALYIRSRNFWAIVIVHALNDFLVVWPTFAAGAGLSVSYVNTGALGAVSLAAYTIVCLLYVPCIVIGLRQLKKTTLPVKSFYQRAWTPIKPQRNKKPDNFRLK